MQEQVEKFLERWEGVEGSELSTSQPFIMELCGLLGVDTPHPKSEEPGSYMFERPLTLTLADGTTCPKRIDCYKRGHFILKPKKLKATQSAKGFDNGLRKAHAQASDYVRALPATEGRPPFILVVDVGIGDSGLLRVQQDWWSLHALSRFQLFSHIAQGLGKRRGTPTPAQHLDESGCTRPRTH
jgi:hypothetical protein